MSVPTAMAKGKKINIKEEDCENQKNQEKIGFKKEHRNQP
jgi:hypothetical protein